jgi:hypothetical protein
VSSNRESRAAKIAEVALAIGTRPEWLDALINFETAGTYSPTIKNPRSTARGLIQITDSTSRDVFGVSNSLALVAEYPTFESQMENVVQPYLEQRSRVYNKGHPLSTRQELYMSVFYPAYMDAPPDKPFPSHVVEVNPGIFTPRDYIDFVNARIKSDALHFPKAVPVVLILLAAATGVWYYLRRT